MTHPLTPGTQIILRSVAIYDADGTVVGEVNAPFGREDEAMARARLWAAAEELREAAIYAVQQMADGEEPDLDDDGDEIEPFQRLRAALAKSGAPA